MSWLTWVKDKLAGPRAAGDGASEAPERARPRTKTNPARRDLERRLATLNQQIAALPDGPERIVKYLHRGIVYKELDELDSALADLARVVEVVPQLADAHAQRGECFLRRADHERAIVSLDRAIALLPAGVKLGIAYLNRGNAWAALGDLEAALADFDRAAEVVPEMAETARQLQERARQQMAEEGKARPRAERARGDRAGTTLEQAWELDAQGDLVGALVAFGKALEHEPGANTYYGRGVVNCKLKRHPEAIADLNRALELRPRFAPALTERGLAYVNGGEIEKGIPDYDAAIAIDPSYALAHVNKGCACLLQKRWAEAVPCLDVALRLRPNTAMARYHRGIAHEMLGDLSRAIRDFQDSLKSEPAGPHVSLAEPRLRKLQDRARDVPAPPFPAPEDLWPVLAGFSLENTVAELVRRVHAERAFFGQSDAPDGGAIFVQFHGRYGIEKHLTEIADAIGPRILTLKLRQFRDLFPAPVSMQAKAPEPPPAPKEGEVERLVEGASLNVLRNGDRVLGVFTNGIEPCSLDLPTVLFGEQPIFGRSQEAEAARRCASCQRAMTYFDAILEDDQLTGYACPHCGANPTPAWVEQRMPPGRWSEAGFLGKDEVLAEVIAGDDRTLARLALGHAQIADALDRLLAGALRASADRIARATAEFEDQLRASGQRGLAGLAGLPLGPTLDELEGLLRDGGLLPAERGTTIDGHDVFLQVYLGYQYCPFTQLRAPWSDDVPPMQITQRRVGNIVHRTAVTDAQLPCRPGSTYRYANLEFLIVHKDTRQPLRGSGLLVHLIRDHHFFEGKQSPFRLDPERAAQVLGLSSLLS